MHVNVDTFVVGPTDTEMHLTRQSHFHAHMVPALRLDHPHIIRPNLVTLRGDPHFDAILIPRINTNVAVGRTNTQVRRPAHLVHLVPIIRGCDATQHHNSGNHCEQFSGHRLSSHNSAWTWVRAPPHCSSGSLQISLA